MKINLDFLEKDSEIAARHIVDENGVEMYFYDQPNSDLYEFNRFRLNTFFHKEPETIRWIKTLQDGDTLWDIGANIGQYGIYACKLRNIKCIAIEPEAQNFSTLTTNIFLNDLGRSVIPYCLALSNNSTYGSIDNRLEVASSRNKIDRVTGNRVGVRIDTIDNLVQNFDFPSPSHLKIDVDGVEHNIIEGGINTIKNAKSVLIELEKKDSSQTVEVLKNLGFKISSINDRGKVGVANYIFDKKVD